MPHEPGHEGFVEPTIGNVDFSDPEDFSIIDTSSIEIKDSPDNYAVVNPPNIDPVPLGLDHEQLGNPPIYGGHEPEVIESFDSDGPDIFTDIIFNEILPSTAEDIAGVGDEYVGVVEQLPFAPESIGDPSVEPSKTESSFSELDAWNAGMSKDFQDLAEAEGFNVAIKSYMKDMGISPDNDIFIEDAAEAMFQDHSKRQLADNSEWTYDSSYKETMISQYKHQLIKELTVDNDAFKWTDPTTWNANTTYLVLTLGLTALKFFTDKDATEEQLKLMREQAEIERANYAYKKEMDAKYKAGGGGGSGGGAVNRSVNNSLAAG